MNNPGVYVSICVAGIIAYLLSLPLAVKLIMFFPRANPEVMIGKVYAPVLFLAQHCETYRVILMWELRMLGIPIGD